MNKYAIILLFLLLLLGYRLYGRPTRDLTHILPKNGSYGKRSLNQIRYIVIHHSGSENQSAFDYANFHIEKGWPGIGYHYVIQPNGKVFKTNSLETVSYHTEGNNAASIGIVLSGDLNSHPMTPSQKRALKGLIRKLRMSLPNQIQVKGHRDFKSTDCPGHFTDISDFS